MPDTDILVSELNSASQINTTDLLLMTQPDGDAQTGYSSRKGTVLQVANKLLKDTEYTTDLPNFDNKSVFGALNEIHNGTYIYKENETPYQLRQTPITANRCLEKLIGVSCAFNQLVQNGNFASVSNWQYANVSLSASDNVLKITATNASTNARQCFQMVNTVAGHKYYITTDIKCDKSQLIYLRFGSISGSPSKTLDANVWDNINAIVNASASSTEFNFYIGVNNNLDSGDSYYVRNAMCIDLTACFGSEVADFIYGLENG